MSKHYYVYTFFTALICIAMVLGVGSCTNSSLSEAQKIDVSFMGKVQVYQDSIKNDSLVPKATKARLDTLFNKWNEAFVQQQKAVYKSQDTLNQNLTIWLSVIAAICTILPIVLAMNQSNSLKAELDLYTEEFKKQKEKLAQDMGDNFDKIQGQKEVVEKELIKYQSEICHTAVITLLNMLSQNLTLLCNLQDIENKENPILTSPSLVKAIISSFKENVDKCQQQFQKEKKQLEDSEKSISSIQNALMSTICSLRDMAYLYENVFNGMNLIKLQHLRDDLSIWMIENASKLKDAKIEDVEESFSEIQKAARDLKALFDTLEDE